MTSVLRSACRASLCIVALFAAPWLAAAAQEAPVPVASPWTRDGQELTLDRYFLLQAPAQLVVGTGGTESDSMAAGHAALEQLGRELGVLSIEPLLRLPPRGHRDPARFAALGLDRMWIVLLAESHDDLDLLVARYAAVAGVERAWRDAAVSGGNTPNDPLWTNQWNLQRNRLDCEDLWDQVTDATAVVAVVDSGCDLDHPDLKNNLWRNPGEVAGNHKDDDGNGFIDDVNGWDFWNNDAVPDDDCGHGSHVAGIIGAQGDDATDVAGICWSARIMSVKVLNATASGTWATIAQGMVYAADNGAVVSNYSLGGHDGDPAVDAAVQYAGALDIVQVAAAGNYGDTIPYYPAAYDGVIAVMASDMNDKRLAWSNHGTWCDLCAPGDVIYSLWKGGPTNVLSGTSMASPHVAAIAALARTINPQLDRIDVEAAIGSGCDDLGSAGPDAEFGGWGRVNARETVLRAAMLTTSATTIATGQSVNLYVDDALHPGDLYIIQPSLTGRLPGYSLSTYFSGDYRVVPIDPDWLTGLALSAPNIGVFDRFIGALDGQGRATATLNVPPGPVLENTTVYFGGITFDPNDVTHVRRVVNTAGVAIR